MPQLGDSVNISRKDGAPMHDGQQRMSAVVTRVGADGLVDAVIADDAFTHLRRAGDPPAPGENPVHCWAP